LEKAALKSPKKEGEEEMVKVRMIKEGMMPGSAQICGEGGGCIWRKRNGNNEWVCNHAAPEMSANGRSCYNFRVMGKIRVKTKVV